MPPPLLDVTPLSSRGETVDCGRSPAQATRHAAAHVKAAARSNVRPVVATTTPLAAFEPSLRVVVTSMALLHVLWDHRPWIVAVFKIVSNRLVHDAATLCSVQSFLLRSSGHLADPGFASRRARHRFGVVHSLRLVCGPSLDIPDRSGWLLAPDASGPQAIEAFTGRHDCTSMRLSRRFSSAAFSTLAQLAPSRG